MSENPKLSKNIYHVYTGSKKDDRCLKFTVIAETAEEASNKTRIFVTSNGANKHANDPDWCHVEPQWFEVLSVECVNTIDIE